MRIAFYTDDPPIKEDKIASGMNRVNSRLCRALTEEISIVIATCYHGYFYSDFIENNEKYKTIFLNWNKYIILFLRKLSIVITSFLNRDIDILFFFQKYKIINEIKKSDSNFLFIPLGSDIKSYKRAIYLREKTKLPLGVYIVDEFLNASILSNNKYGEKLCKESLRSYLENTETIFVISEGMRNYLKKEYAVESFLLNLPFEKKYNDILEKKLNEVLFLGNVSHFYKDGLLTLGDAIVAYNHKNNIKLYLRLTTNEIPDIFDSQQRKYIKFGKIEGEVELAKTINRSLFCYIPYSYDTKYKVMVSTSFPSKTLECMAYARKILINAPEYSSSIKYFEKNNLGEYLVNNDFDTILKFLENEMSNVCEKNNLNYIDILERNHSYIYIKSIIQEGYNK